MNHYQQNNFTASQSISVCFLSVTFVSINSDSNVHNLITRLSVVQKEFEKGIKWGLPVQDLKLKAVELSSTLEALMDASRDVQSDKRRGFSLKVIESTFLVLEQYQRALEVDGFSREIPNELKKYVQQFFNDNFGRIFDERFWFNLKCYEWFLKEGWVADYHSRYGLHKAYEPTFSKEQLEEFFTANRKEIIGKMLNCERLNNSISFDSPLADLECNESYKIFNQLHSLK